MGKGKGAVDRWICFLKKGSLILLLSKFCNLYKSLKAIKHLSQKLPLSTKMIVQ